MSDHMEQFLAWKKELERVWDNPGMPLPAPPVGAPRTGNSSTDDPEQGWIIEGWLRQGQTGVLVSATTAGKSMVAASWADAVARHGKWCGHAAGNPKTAGGAPSAPGAVLVLAAEDPDGFKMRLDGARVIQGDRDLRQLDPLMFHARLPCTLDDPRLPEVLQGMTSWIELTTLSQGRQEEVVLVIVDTLAASISRTFDINNQPAVAGVFDGLREGVGRDAGVVLVHHAVKGVGVHSMPTLSDALGSAAFAASSFSYYGVARGRDGRVAIKALKLKSDPLPPKLIVPTRSIELPNGRSTLALDTRNAVEVTGRDGDDGDGAGDADAEPAELTPAERLIETVRSGRLSAKKAIAREAGVRYQDALELLRELEKGGVIRKEDGVWIAPSGAASGGGSPDELDADEDDEDDSPNSNASDRPVGGGTS